MEREDRGKHTLGPWTHSGRTILAVREGGNTSVAHCMTRGMDPLCDIETFDEAAGNARLIAAAPDMLEACQHALPLLKHLNKFLKYQRPGREFWPNREDGDATLGTLTAAIAKAKGPA